MRDAVMPAGDSAVDVCAERTAARTGSVSHAVHGPGRLGDRACASE
jgi:hypothetical protein